MANGWLHGARLPGGPVRLQHAARKGHTCALRRSGASIQLPEQLTAGSSHVRTHPHPPLPNLACLFAAAHARLASSTLQAVEANQGSTKFVFIRNDARTPAMYVYFWVSTWGGGMWGQNAVYDGTFV